MAVSGVGRTGESRWMRVDSWIVEDRHGCLSGCPSGRLSGCLNRVGCQRFGLGETLGHLAELGVSYPIMQNAVAIARRVGHPQYIGEIFEL